MKIINAKIYTMCGDIINNGFVEFNNKITAVGIMEDFPGGEAYDAKGLMIFPGFVDAHTHLGICEDSLGFEGDDCNEMTDPCTPHLRAIDAINVLDICFNEALRAGVTCVLSSPGSSNPIAGQITAIKTYGRCIDDMIVKAPVAMKFALGENPKTVYNEKKTAPSTRMATAAIIREQLTKAREYITKRNKEDENEFDARLEALSLLFEQELPAHIHAHRADDIFTAVRLSNEFGIKYSIVHCTQGHLIANELADKGVTAMSGPLLCDRSKPELKDSSPATPGILSKAGIKTAIVTDHPVIPIQYLALCAGLAVREGMDYYEAIKSITVNPAEICGISDSVGSIAVGKDADIVLFDTDPLTLNAKPKMVIASGEIVFS
jgi:imidazolonepropionase-like amidohydrolase